MAEKSNIGEVTLKNVRLSFPHIFKPQPFKNGEGEPKYNCSFLLHKEKNKAEIEAMRKAINGVAKEKWPTDMPKLKPEKLCMRDGDVEDWDGYPGHYYVSASNKRRPAVIDRNRSPLTEDDGKPYAGCYVNAVVRVWAQDSKEFGKRINASLEAIQFVKDGDAFGAKPVDVNEKFDDLGDTDGETEVFVADDDTPF